MAQFISGAFLFWSEAARLYPSYSYRAKFVLIFLLGINALLFHTTIYKSVDKWNTQAPRRFAPKWRAGSALRSGWSNFFGRWTAYNLK